MRLQIRNSYSKEEFLAVVHENERLREENNILRARIGELERTVKLLQAKIFGRSTEKSPLQDTCNSSAKESLTQAARHSPKRRNYHHLPLVEISCDLPPNQKECPSCGKPFAPFIDVIEGATIEIEVRGYRRQIHRKSYRKQCKCPRVPTIVTADSPGKLLSKGSLGITVWIKLLLNKFQFYQQTKEPFIERS